ATRRRCAGAPGAHAGARAQPAPRGRLPAAARRSRKTGAVNDPSLASAFLRRWKGRAPDGEGQAALEASLSPAFERARAAWPGVTVEAAAFAEWCGARAPEELEAVEALAQLRADDLYLACGCESGVPAALKAFDERLLARVPLFLSRLDPEPQLIESTRQSLRDKLFVAAAGKPAKIAQYQGRGALEGWLRVVA